MNINFDRKVVLLSIVFTYLFCPIDLYAQEEEWCDSPKKKALKAFERADQRNFRGDASILDLREAIEVDPEYALAHYYLGLIYTERYESAYYMYGPEAKSTKNLANRVIKYFNNSLEFCPDLYYYEAYYQLGIFHFERKEYDIALAYLKSFTESNDKKDSKKWKKADNLLKDAEIYHQLMSNPVPYKPEKVPGVSTSDDEYLPILSPDNKYMYYTKRQFVDTKTLYGKVEKELFIRGKNSYDGTFKKGEVMPHPFNQGQYQGGASISVDNKLIFITVLEVIRVGGAPFNNADIYYSEWQDGEWTELKSVGNHINHQLTWEGQPSISADNSTLYFSCWADTSAHTYIGGHYGGMDLYKSERQEDGSWGIPINLGPSINTSGDEKSPFMHSDSYTLYFTSNGHIGVGGHDIFYSKLENNGSFRQVKNIGYPINTEDDENGFIVSTDGKYGYFSSGMDERSLCVYSFELYKEARPEKVIFVRGESLTGPDAVKNMDIVLKNVATNQETHAVIDEESGEYVGVIAAKEGEDVLMTAKKDGYAFSSQYISSNENIIGKPIEKNLEAKPLQKGESYKINNIQFATNSFELNGQTQAILDEFSEFMTRNPGIEVEIHGHTDNVGDPAKNKILSENRAKSVYQYLLLHDISASRLSYKGFGQSKPVAENTTSEGRAKNRRTEFLITSL